MIVRFVETGNHIRHLTKIFTHLNFSVSLNSTYFDILWSRYMTKFPAYTYNRDIYYNHVDVSKKLTTKLNLYAVGMKLKLDKYFPTIYRSLKNENLFNRYGMPRFVMKSKHHRGVKYVTQKYKREDYIFQERVQPLLLNGHQRMFDVGIYVLLQVNPFRYHIYSTELVRICKKRYPTAFFVNESFDSYVINDYMPIWNDPFFKYAIRKCNKNAGCALKHMLKIHNIPASLIFKKMRDLISLFMNYLSMSRSKDIIKKSFELLRFDFMIDNILNPKIMECNMSPSMIGTHIEDQNMKIKLISDTMDIVLSKNASQTSQNGNGWIKK